MSSSSKLIRSSLNGGREGVVLIGLIPRAHCQTEYTVVVLQVCWKKENQKRSWEAQVIRLSHQLLLGSLPFWDTYMCYVMNDEF